MNYRFFITIACIIQSLYAEPSSINDEDFLPILSSRTTSIQKAVYSLHLKGEQIGLACAFTEKGDLITSLQQFKEGTLIKDERGGLYPVDLIGSDRKSHITVIRAPFKLSPPNYGNLSINTGKILTSVN